MLYISNAFSLQMLGNPAFATNIRVSTPWTVEEVKEYLNTHEFLSAVGHADTAACLTNMLGVEIHNNRVNLTLTPDDKLFVAQVMGGRLPEGATTLPENVTIKFMMVTITYTI